MVSLMTSNIGRDDGNETPSSGWHEKQPNGYEARRHYSNGQDSSVTDTEFLIVGAGPAGASLACFLASYGESGPKCVVRNIPDLD